MDFGMFGDSKRNSDEIGKLWERLVPLERAVESLNSKVSTQSKQISELDEKVKQPTDTAKEAKSAFAAISQYRSRIKKIKEELSDEYAQANEIYTSIKSIDADTKHYFEKIENLYGPSLERAKQIEELLDESERLKTSLLSNSESLVELVSSNEDLENELTRIHDQITEIDDVQSKSESMLKTIVSNHSRIRDLRNEILGYEETDESGNAQKIEGLKDELEQSYHSISDQLAGLENQVKKVSDETNTKYHDILKASESKSDEQLKTYQKKYDDTFAEITKLLPQALTAGLSAAYDAKVTEEREYQENHNTTFKKAIWGLIAVSIIPFTVDIYLLLALHKDLIEVIADTPKLIISILPLYLPILWIAYSASKKQKLSKRLIEEYTHKGVLSKTFEGLSNQISELDDDVSEELRVKLLFNLLQVNSENPGKLISDYNTTDHPLMDALDKSSRLGLAIDKLNNIPGFGKLVKTLEKKQEKVLREQNERVSEVIEKTQQDT